MNSLYVRIRGRVQGPFELPMLQAMTLRGQLSRIHMVSEDQVDWRKASEYPELFEPPFEPPSTAGKERPKAKEQGTRRSDKISTTHQQPVGKEKSDSGPTDWYVEISGDPHGPFNFAELQQEFHDKGLSANAQVWREGMTKWVPARTISNLTTSSSKTQSYKYKNQVDNGSSPREFKSSFSSEVVDRLAGGRRWIVAASMFSFALGVLVAMGGFNVVWRGIPNSLGMVGLGIVLFLIAIGCSVLGFIAMNYSYTIQNAELMRTDDNIFANLDDMNRCWKFLALFLLVILVAIIGLILVCLFIIDDSTLFGSIPDIQTAMLWLGHIH